MKILKFVRQFIELGISVIPLYHRSKEPMLPSWRDYQTSLPTEYQLENWLGSTAFPRHRNANQLI